MIYVMLAIAVIASAETIRMIVLDGRGPTAPPASHYRDTTFGPARVRVR